ncbi:MAG: hypothetical protein PHY26_03760 [Bacilli bacterium]|nr:hypothetical protein [Bacilli bacterium]
MDRRYDDAVNGLLNQKRGRYKVTGNTKTNKKTQWKQTLIALTIASLTMAGMTYWGIKTWEKEDKLRTKQTIEYLEELEKGNIVLDELEEIDQQNELDGRPR